MRVYLVRHGETDANRQHVIQGSLVDHPLNARGQTQARALARFFADQRDAGLHVDAVCSSPLLRARETALHIANGLNRPHLTQLDGLREFSWGAYMGQENRNGRHEGMKRILDAWGAGDFDAHAPRGETLHDAWTRAWRDLEALIHAHKNDVIVLVGHGRINKIILSMLLHESFHHMEEFPQRNAGYTLLEQEGEAWYAPLRDAALHLEGVVALEERA